MDECTLNDLLECSVCLERLDTSSKVLPCQHTFCKKCLEEIVVTKKELRCPECRVLVETSIDDLPPNVLLMRILEGMRNAAPKRRSTGAPAVHHQRSHSQPIAGTIFPATTVAAAVPANVTQHTPAPEGVTRSQSAVKQMPVLTLPYARAVYDYISKEPGDLSFKKGDIITLKKQVDQNWYHGEIGGVHGVFPLCYVQIMPAPANIPQCKALYDFRMTNDEEEGCLSFTKGEIITVIRRVDENWAEGRLGDRIGIFPIAFVEMNGVARAFMKLSTNIQPGPSRLAPPTPTSEETTPLIPTDHSHAAVPSQLQHQTAQQTSQPQLQPQAPLQTQSQPHITPQSAPQSVSHISHTMPQPSSLSAVPKPPTSVATSFPQTDSSSSISSSSTTPITSSTSSSSSSSTTPSSPASPPPRPLPSAWSPQPRPSRPTSASHEASQQKRHSLTALLATPTHQASSNRHSAEVLGSADITETSMDAPNGEFVRQGSGRHHRRSGSSELPLSTLGSIPPPLPQGIHHSLVNNSNLPATYIALYPYKPQKADELELRKGGVYTVTERCQDGWFKGTSNRTQKSGVFPGNYVAFVKSLVGVQSQLRSVPRGSVNASTPTRSISSGAVSPHSASVSSTSTTSPSPVSYTRERKSNSTSPQSSNVRQQQTGSEPPPSLPPRSVSPASSSNTPSSVSRHVHQSTLSTTSSEITRTTPSTSPQTLAAQTSQNSPQSSSQGSISPNTTVSTASNTPTGTPSKVMSDKAKDKKERGSVSLMRRLTNMKKSKSPPPPYSMDNPVFEDGSLFGTPTHSIHPAHPIHVRSGSCPSQLLQLPQPELTSTPNHQSQAQHHRLLSGPAGAGGSQRIRHKERPNVVMANFALSGRSGEAGAAGAAGAAVAAASPGVPSSHHRKSNSLDAGSSHGTNGTSHNSPHGESSRKSKQLVQPARERFRCVVPYPPHSEYELELRVGDVIYVHRKREDGWYKGTQQRTGRTGLFPASFVEAF